MNKKFKKKKTLIAERAGGHYEDANNQVVCEDIENESEDVENSLNYEDNDCKDQAGKRERIKQMGDPHQIMQE